MPLKFFTIVARDDDVAEAELNAFLGRHRILTIDRHWVDVGADSYWSFCVDYFTGSDGKAPDSGGRVRSKDDKGRGQPVKLVLPIPLTPPGRKYGSIPVGAE